MDIAIGSPLVLGPSNVTSTAPFGKAGEPFVPSTLDAQSIPANKGDPEKTRPPVEEAITSIKSFVQNIQRDLDFSLDDSSGRVVVKVTDSASGEVIRQLPSEDALRLAESLEEVRSLLFKAEA